MSACCKISKRFCSLATADYSSNVFVENFQKLIIQTIITWAKCDLVADQNLIRAMFSLFHRQYDGVSEVILLIHLLK